VVGRNSRLKKNHKTRLGKTGRVKKGLGKIKGRRTRKIVGSQGGKKRWSGRRAKKELKGGKHVAKEIKAGSQAEKERQLMTGGSSARIRLKLLKGVNKGGSLCKK